VCWPDDVCDANAALIKLEDAYEREKRLMRDHPGLFRMPVVFDHIRWLQRKVSELNEMYQRKDGA
jgi:hypothetical protein